MPKLMSRKAAEVPAPSSVNKAVQEQQRLYENLIQQASDNVGEIFLDPDESMRSVKVRLRRASARTSTPLEIWDANGKGTSELRSQFQAEVEPARPQEPAKSPTILEIRAW